jgi:hypothetical protein
MKKLVLSLISIFAACAIHASSIQVIPSAMTVSGPSNTVLPIYATVKNIGGGTIDLKISRTINNLATGHQSYFCFEGACFPPTTSVSPMALTMFPSDTNSTFIADVNPYGNIGVSYVTYCFYDASNPSDSVCLSFTFEAGTTSVLNLNNNDKFLSAARPNPANLSTAITYSLPSTTLDAKIVISNMLGSTIKEINLNERSNMMMLDTEGMLSGVYVYTLFSDGRALATKKLIVKH